jgi:hypothetical protein
MPYTNNNDNMDQQQPNNSQPSADSPEMQNRRELVTKLGKYAIYAAPFTVMALNSKAATASGPKRH